MATKGKEAWKVSPMFERYYKSHGPQHLPCPSPAEIEADYRKLKAKGLTDAEAFYALALEGKGAMSVSNTSGGGKLPAFYNSLRKRGIKI
jgi:hypothetical protein